MVKNKTTKGAVTVANMNDTDSDGIIDNIDNSVTQVNQNHGINEIDLMKLEITWTGPIPVPTSCVNIELVTTGKIEFWEQNYKGSKAVKTIPISKLLAQSSKTIVLYVEATDVSTAIRDISIKAVLDGVLQDEVKATAIWSEMKAKYITRATSGTNNPSPSSLGIDEVPLVDAIEWQYIAKDNSQYGIGTNSLFNSTVFQKSSSTCNSTLYTGRDSGFGGRILMEFKILPVSLANNLNSLGIIFDIGRQIEEELKEIKFGNSSWTLNTIKFPVIDEEVNDDKINEDEDLIPTNSEIYSFDNPSHNYALPTSYYNNFKRAFVKRHSKFKEFVRVSFGTTSPKGDMSIKGSRMSAKLDWEVGYSLKNSILPNVDNPFGTCEHYLSEITTNPSVSDPINLAFIAPQNSSMYPATTAKGNIKVKLLANPTTTAYTLEYTAAGWSLFSNSISSGKTLIGSISTISGTITDTDKIEVEIINNLTNPFTNNSIYHFNTLNEPNIVNTFIK